MSETYKASTANQDLEILNLNSLEQQAAQIIPKGAFGYISGGAGDEWTMRRNQEAFNSRQIIPRVLADLEKPDTSTTFFNMPLTAPIIMSPAAAHGLSHAEGEVATARGVAEFGSIMGISTYANTTIEETAAASGASPWWFQLYMSKDDDFNHYLLDKAKNAGAKAVILTADSTVGGNREADARNHFAFPLPMANLAQFGEGKGQGIGAIYAKALQRIKPSDVEKIASYTKLPVIVKGIQAPEDAMIAIASGASAVYVSNHGGRQLDGGPGSFDVLASIADSVAKKVPVIFDSGIRRGQHVFKALASGADVVGIGRPVLYGLALGGEKGVVSVFKHLLSELKMVMQLAGTRNVEEIKRARLLSTK